MKKIQFKSRTEEKRGERRSDSYVSALRASSSNNIWI